MEDLKELLGEELFSQVEAKLEGKKLMVDDKNFIPKSRFDEKNNLVKELQSQLTERDNQLAELSKKANLSDEAQATIKALQEQNEAYRVETETKIKNMKIDNEITNLLKENNAKYSDLLMGKFDRSLLNVKEDGTIEGLKTQFDAIKESYSDMFEGSKPLNTGGVGGIHRGSGQSTSMTKEQYKKLSLAEKMKLYTTDKETYDKFN